MRNTGVRGRFDLAASLAVIIILVVGACQQEERSIVVHGDSTAIASRIPMTEKLWNVAPWLDRTRWWNIVAESYDPDRSIYNDGEKGQSITRLRDKILAEQSRTAETTIIYDRINSDESPDAYLVALSAAVGALRTTHLLIMPQVPNSLGTPDPHAARAMPVINAELLRRWPRNTFSVSERDRFLAELASPKTRADGTHRNAEGQLIEARYIKAWLAARGW